MGGNKTTDSTLRQEIPAADKHWGDMNDKGNERNAVVHSTGPELFARQVTETSNGEVPVPSLGCRTYSALYEKAN